MPLPSLPDRPICIFGTGGFARETLCCLLDTWRANGSPTAPLTGRVCFMVSDDQYDAAEVMGVPVIRESAFDATQYAVLVAVAEPAIRRRIVARLPATTTYATLIHPTAVVSDWVEIGEGSIIAAGVVLTCNIRLGRHAQLNLHVSVGHDCEIGAFFTAAPGARLSGGCQVGADVYVGTNAALRQNLTIAADVTVGMGSVVVKSIAQSGVYAGNPLRRLAEA